MIDPRIALAIAALWGAWILGEKTVHGVKWLGRETSCLVRTGHKCPPKPPVRKQD